MILDAKPASGNVAHLHFFEVVPDVLTIATLDGRFEDVNPAFTTSLGWSLEDLRGKPMLSLVHCGDHENTAAELDRLRQGAASVTFENRCRTKVGGHRCLAWTVTRVDEGLIGIGREVQSSTGREDALGAKVQAQAAELAAANKALAASNDALEQVAVAASHDLQEPLQGIAGYCHLLQRQYTGKLDASAQRYISKTLAGVERMSTLITNLREFARVSCRGQPFQLTDFNVVLQETLARLKIAAALGAKVECSNLPTLSADPEQMIRLFHNLIDNAIKYHGPRTPEVRLTAEEKPHEVVFSVHDNGIGVDAQYFERIFVIFQRLHTQEEYPGTGIGLALCKRIVERHGGRIWVESEVGKGTTIAFTISKQLRT